MPTWYIGLITPETQFIALNQGIDANATWQQTVLAGPGGTLQPTGTESIDGLTWTVYDKRDAKDPGNFAYSMATTIDGSTVLLHGTAATAEFELLASSIAAEVQ